MTGQQSKWSARERNFWQRQRAAAHDVLRKLDEPEQLQLGGQPSAASRSDTPAADAVLRNIDAREQAVQQIAARIQAPDIKERFEERAAIREYDGKQPRGEAEQAALAEVLWR